MLYHPTIAVGTISKFTSLWKGPYITEKCLNDVTFRINERNSSKQQMLQYGRLKPFFEPPLTSNVTTKNKQRIFWSTHHIAVTHNHVDGTLNREDCVSFLPAVFSVPMPIGRGITIISTSTLAPIISPIPTKQAVTGSHLVFMRSPKPEPSTSRRENDVGIQVFTALRIEIQPLLTDNAFPTKDSQQA